MVDEVSRVAEDELGKGRVSLPLIALLSRKSLLMVFHLQGISPMLEWMRRDGGGNHLKIGGREQEQTGGLNAKEEK